MKASTVLDKMDEIEKKYPAEQRWHKLRLLLMAATQAESQLTPVAADVCDCYICVPAGNYPDLCAHCGKKARR